jgi:ATP-dependent helicase/nuclease subunit B
VPADGGVPQVWARVAQAAAAFLAQQRVPPQSAVVVLPFAQLAQPARVGWAGTQPQGFQPAFESTLSWCARLAPGLDTRTDAAGLSGDRRVDLLAAQGVLQQARLPALRANLDAHASTLLALTQELCETVATVPPEGRGAWWAQAQAAARAVAAPADAVLLQLALSWAAQSGPPATDALWAQRPGAVVATFAGDAPLLSALCTHWAGAGVPVLALQVEARPAALAAQPVMPPTHDPQVRFLRAHDIEHEATLASQAVLAALNQRPATDTRPVALVAQDRLVVRRVRALLARQAVPMADETGWALSTTQVGAWVMGLLRSAAPDAPSDEVLAWLRSLPPSAAPVGLDDLEAALRKAAGAGVSRVALWRDASHRFAEHPAVAQVQPWLAGLKALMQAQAPGRRAPQSAPTLWQWLQALRDAMAPALQAPLLADPAGEQLWAALGLAALASDDRAAPASAGHALLADTAQATPMDHAGFVRWVNDTLEAAHFRPESAVATEVVITPLARAGLRDFAEVVMPGCDGKQLGVLPSLPGAWGAAQRQALGLPTVASLHAQTEHHWALVVAGALGGAQAQPATFIGRLRQGDQALAVPALVLRTQRTLGLGWADPPLGPVRPLAAQGQSMPAPALPPALAPHLLPASLSASAYSALRACPYRFFGLRLLGLQEAQELDDTLEKREWGTWLHEVLRQFHQQRAASPAAADAAALLYACAQRAAAALDEAQALPFMAAWPDVAEAYLSWLAREEAQGHHFHAAELPVTGGLALDSGTVLPLTGRLDRVDTTPQGERVIDYKTTSRSTLKAQLKDPGEEVQLAFYGLLRPSASAAVYLSFHDSPSEDQVAALPLKDLADASAALAQGLRADWQRIGAGAPMPALGEEPACARCEAAGLCRKAHWGPV